MSQILILGSLRDPHVARVVAEIERQGGPDTVVLDVLQSTETSFAVGVDGSYALSVGGQRIDRPCLVWDRLKMNPGSALGFDPQECGKQTTKWRTSEWRVYCTMIAGVFGTIVVNSLKSRVCLAKPYQQVVAAASGFSVPQTLIANRKAPIVDFVHSRDAIIKTLSAEPVRSDDPASDRQSVVMTMAIPRERVARADDAQFSLAPHFIQQNIPKRYELRVVVIDQEVLAFRILSQQFASSRTDWREGSHVVKFESWAVDDEVAASLRRFMQVTGLFSGSFDLIVDPDGRVWFVECNQDGQWGWLDDIVDGAVAKSFARALIARARDGVSKRSRPLHGLGAVSSAAVAEADDKAVVDADL